MKPADSSPPRTLRHLLIVVGLLVTMIGICLWLWKWRQGEGRWPGGKGVEPTAGTAPSAIDSWGGRSEATKDGPRPSPVKTAPGPGPAVADPPVAPVNVPDPKEVRSGEKIVVPQAPGHVPDPRELPRAPR